MREDIILKRWSFESGIPEGSTTVGDITLSLSADSRDGSQSLQLSPITPSGTLSGHGYVGWSLGDVPPARCYQVDCWIKEGVYLNLPNAAIMLTQGNHDSWIAGIQSDRTHYFPLLNEGDGISICGKMFNTWVHLSFVWEVSTGITHYAVRDADNNLVGSIQNTIQANIGMIPKAIWCAFRATFENRSFLYDEIVVTAIGVLAPSSRRRRAAWQNLERPLF